MSDNCQGEAMSGSSSIQERAPCSLREGKRTMKVVDVSFVADGINSNWPITGSTSKIRVHRIPSRIIENTCYESAYDHFHTQLIRDCNSSLIRREITLHRNHIDHIPWIHRIGIFACASVQLVYGPFCLVHAVDCVYLRKDKKYVQRISMMASWSREKPLGYIWTVGHGHTYCSLIFIIRSCFSGFGPLDNRIKATYESSSPIQLINSTSSSLLNRYKYSLHPEWGMIRSSIPKKKNEQ